MDNQHLLYDADTTECLGEATPEQVAASDAAERKHGTGIILVDEAGHVVSNGSPGRKVYTL